MIASSMKPNTHGAARIGIGGPVGSGKTALIEALIPLFSNSNIEVGIVTNDLVTKEDAYRLQKSGLIDPERVVAVEAGACPHTVIREDPTLNIAAAENLEAKYEGLDLVIIESGGDNLASTFSLDLVDWWMFVIDVAQGDDIPRKKGPGIIQSDLLVINKVDLAPFVGVDAKSIQSEAQKIRGKSPVISCQCRNSPGNKGVQLIANEISVNLLFTREQTQ